MRVLLQLPHLLQAAQFILMNCSLPLERLGLHTTVTQALLRLLLDNSPRPSFHLQCESFNLKCVSYVPPGITTEINHLKQGLSPAQLPG